MIPLCPRTGKNAYPTRQEAARRLMALRGRNDGTYHCRFCGGYHWGERKGVRLRRPVLSGTAKLRRQLARALASGDMGRAAEIAQVMRMIDERRRAAERGE